jgi:hypothetical protein
MPRKKYFDSYAGGLIPCSGTGTVSSICLSVVGDLQIRKNRVNIAKTIVISAPRNLADRKTRVNMAKIVILCTLYNVNFKIFVRFVSMEVKIHNTYKQFHS